MAGFGVVNYATNLVVASLLHEFLGMGEELALLSAMCCSLGVGFLVCRHFVFDAGDGAVQPQLLRFAAAAAVFRMAEYGGFLVLHSGLGVNYLMAIALLPAASFVVKFLFFGRFVFRSHLFASGMARGVADPAMDLRGRSRPPSHRC